MDATKKRDVKFLLKNENGVKQQVVDASIPSLLSRKDRARNHRERKKKYGVHKLNFFRYYEDLEQQIKILKEQVRRLISENDQLKNSSNYLNITNGAQKNRIMRLEEEEKFINEYIPRMIETDPDKFRYTLYDQSRELCFAFGSERVKVLKDAFRTIIDNVIPLQFKVFLTMFTQSTPARCIKLGKDKNKYNRTAYKFHKATTSASTTTKAGAKDGCGEDIEEILSRFTFSDRVLDQWKVSTDIFHGLLKKIRKNVKKLVKIRNVLFSLLKKIHDTFYDNNVFDAYTRQDICQLGKLSTLMKGSDLISPHKLWLLSEKTTAEDEFLDDQYSTN